MSAGKYHPPLGAFADAPALYTATDDERRLATEWHGGASSMLYAVASTGALSRGTIWPAGCSTVDQWSLSLVDRLTSELRDVARLAATHPTEPDHVRDLATARAWLDKLTPITRHLVALTEQETDQ